MRRLPRGRSRRRETPAAARLGAVSGMTVGSPSQPSVRAGYTERIRAWERRSPWYRRLTARTGLQGKLVLCFMFLLTMALGASCWLFVSETREVMERTAGQQAE